MRISMKKFIEYFLAFGIAFMVFAAMVISENAQFQILSKVENPFEKAEIVDGIMETTSEKKEVFTPSAELFVLHPESKIDLSSKHREVLSGEVFTSFYLMNDQAYQKAESALPLQNIFWDKDFSPTVGQLQVGPLTIHAPGSNLFIIRDPEEQKSEIYVSGHSAEIFFDGASHPFVIPAGMYVSVKENLVNKKTASLFHSKLKKEWRLRPFSFPVTPEGSAPEDKFLRGIKELRIWENRIREFALNAPESWRITHKDSWGTKILESVRNIQNKFALGLPQEVKDQRDFNNLLQPFVKTHFLIKDRKKLLATRTITDFGKSLDDLAWKTILKRNPKINESWSTFFQAHTAWLRTIFPGDPEEVFIDFWLERFSQESFKKIEKTFSNAELLFSNQSYQKANEEFIKLQKMIEEIEISKDHSFELTKIRRLFVEILRNEVFFQSEEMFDFYRTLIGKEVILQSGSELQDEIRLESAQDILFFLNTFLEDRSKINISRILLKAYSALDVDDVVARMGRDIFTEEESELITFISMIGNAGITQQELDAIKNAKAYQDELDERIKKLQAQKEEDDPQKEETLHTSAGIQNAKDLKNFFEENNVNTQKMTFKTIRAENLTQFAQGSFNRKNIEGEFQYDTQLFSVLTVGKSTKESLHTRFFSGFLAQEKDEVLPETINTKPDIFISQTTPRAILERKLIQELLELEGFSISLDKIEILDETMQKIKIHNATLANKYDAKFFFLRDSEKITQVILSFGKSKIDFGEKEFPVTNSGNILTQEMEKLGNSPDEQ